MIATTEATATGADIVVDATSDRISWGAVFAGTVTTLAVMLVLSLIGMGIGLSTLDPQTGDNPSGTAIGVGAVVWWVISSLISFYVGGLIAGRAADSRHGYLHGMITWATVTLLSLILLTSAIGRALSGATGLAQFATNLAPDLKNRVSAAATDLQNQATGAQPGPANPNTNPNMEQQARETGEKAAKGGAMGSFGAALALILAGAAAALGGHAGRRAYLRDRTNTMSSTEPVRSRV
jgi:hypothetical protein